jgi:hypothetical protein
VNPAKKPVNSISTPITQVASRGLRKAPVKNVRNMCTTIAAMNSSAAQWCTCRMNSPPRTSNVMFSALS